MDLAFDPLRAGGIMDLTQSDIPRQVADLAMQVARTRTRAEMPPPEILFLHRRSAGCTCCCRGCARGSTWMH